MVPVALDRVGAGSPLPGALLFPLASVVERVEVRKIFPRMQPLEVELGCGDASFLVEYAGAHPERNFIGVERLRGRLRKLDRKGRRRGLTNLLGIRIEAAYFAEYLLPEGAVDAFHIYFPDPWPKRKHWQRRLVNDRFPQVAWRMLVPGGAVYLRTDDAAYHAQMRAVFTAHVGFDPIDPPAELLGLSTDFERDFRARGIETRHAAFRKRTIA